MSAADATTEAPARPRVTLPELAAKKLRGEPIVMVTAHDLPTATACERAGVDLVLVGDTAAMTVLGYPGTEPVSFEEMLMLGRAVRRGLRTPLMVGDLPLGTYEASDELAAASAIRMVKETGCDVVKLEGAGVMADRARAIRAAGIGVMGHIGLTPQSQVALGGFRTQAKTADAALALHRDALALERAGCFAIVFEAVPGEVAAEIARRIDSAVIGIGAGAGVDGQVLVLADMLGIFDRFTPRFVRRYAELGAEMRDAIAAYAADVRERRFPAAEHGYAIDDEQLAAFRSRLDPPPGANA